MYDPLCKLVRAPRTIPQSKDTVRNPNIRWEQQLTILSNHRITNLEQTTVGIIFFLVRSSP